MARRHLFRMLGIIIAPYLLLILGAAFLAGVVWFIQR
jgi:hypothetical protein